MPDLDPKTWHFLALIPLMFGAGVAGSYCRHVLDRTYQNTRWLEIVVPGVVAAFVIPLFLSIGKSEIFSSTIKGGEELYSNMLIIAAFCLLAGVSSRNFVDALASDALKAANRAEKKADRAVASAAETKDIVAEDLEPPPEKLAPPAEDVRHKVSDQASDREKALIEVFLAHPNKARVLSSLAKEMGADEADTFLALSSLVKRKIISSYRSERTGSKLYRLTAEL